MKNIFTAALFSIALAPAYAADTVGLDYSNARQEILDSGDVILVPEGVVTIPGLPVVVSELDLEATASARRQLELNGFVDRPDEDSIADNALRSMKQREREGDDAYLHRTDDFDFAGKRLGRVDKAILNPESEGFVSASPNLVFRVYSDTKFGNIYVSELAEASMGIAGDTQYEFNFRVAGYQGFLSRVRYAGGKMTTVVMVYRDGGVIFVELGSAFYGESGNAELLAFIETLLTNDEA